MMMVETYFSGSIMYHTENNHKSPRGHNRESKKNTPKSVITLTMFSHSIRSNGQLAPAEPLNQKEMTFFQLYYKREVRK